MLFSFVVGWGEGRELSGPVEVAHRNETALGKLGCGIVDALAVFEGMRPRSTAVLEGHQLTIGGSAASCIPWAA